MAKWMTGGDKHTGWKDAKTGERLTDAQARERIDQADRDYADRQRKATGRTN